MSHKLLHSMLKPWPLLCYPSRYIDTEQYINVVSATLPCNTNAYFLNKLLLLPAPESYASYLVPIIAAFLLISVLCTRLR